VSCPHPPEPTRDHQHLVLGEGLRSPPPSGLAARAPGRGVAPPRGCAMAPRLLPQGGALRSGPGRASADAALIALHDCASRMAVTARGVGPPTEPSASSRSGRSGSTLASIGHPRGGAARRSPPGPEPQCSAPGEASSRPCQFPWWSNASTWSSPASRKGAVEQALSSKVLVITVGRGGQDHPDQRVTAHHGGQEATHPALRGPPAGRQADAANTGLEAKTIPPVSWEFRPGSLRGFKSARPSCRWSCDPAGGG